MAAQIAYVTDAEGNMDWFRAYVGLSKFVSYADEASRHLVPSAPALFPTLSPPSLHAHTDAQTTTSYASRRAHPTGDPHIPDAFFHKPPPTCPQTSIHTRIHTHARALGQLHTLAQLISKQTSTAIPASICHLPTPVHTPNAQRHHERE